MGRKTKTLDQRRSDLSTEHRGLLLWVFINAIFDHKEEIEAKLEKNADAPRPLLSDGVVRWSVKRYLDSAASSAESALWSRRMKLLSDLELVHKEGNLVRLTRKGRATLRKLYSSGDALAGVVPRPYYALLLADYERDQSETILEAIEIAREQGAHELIEGKNGGLEDLYRRLTSSFNVANWTFWG